MQTAFVESVGGKLKHFMTIICVLRKYIETYRQEFSLAIWMVKNYRKVSNVKYQDQKSFHYDEVHGIDGEKWMAQFRM